MDTICEFEREFLRQDFVDGDKDNNASSPYRIQQLLKDPINAQRVILEYLQQVAQLTVELNYLTSESRQVYCAPVTTSISGFAGNAAHRTSIIKRLSSSTQSAPLRFARSIMQRQPAVAPIQSTPQSPPSTPLHRRGSDSNLKVRKGGKQKPVTTQNSHEPSTEDSTLKTPHRPISIRSDGSPKGPFRLPLESNSSSVRLGDGSVSPSISKRETSTSTPMAPSGSSLKLSSSLTVTNAANSNSSAKRERKISTSTMASRDSQLNNTDQRRPARASDQTASGFAPVPSTSKIEVERRATPPSRVERRSKAKTLSSVFGGLFSRKSKKRTSNLQNGADGAGPNGSSPRRRMPKFLRNIAGRRSRRHNNSRLSGSSSSLRKHDATSTRKAVCETSGDTSNSTTGAAAAAAAGAGAKKKPFSKGATIAAPDRMRYVDPSGYNVHSEPDAANASSSNAQASVSNAGGTGSLKSSNSGEFARVRTGSMINSTISKRMQQHLSQISTLKVPTVIEIDGNDCDAVTATIPPVTHHYATLIDKSTLSSEFMYSDSSNAERRSTNRQNFDKEITDWLSRTRERLEKLLGELSTLLQSTNDKHSFSPFSASTLARILVGVSDEERVRQLRSEYERHLMLERQLKFALMRQHHTVLYAIATLLDRQLDINVLRVSLNRSARRQTQKSRKVENGRPLRRAFTMNSRLFVSNAVYNGMLCASLLEQATECLLDDASRFSEDIVRNLLRALDESNERTQVLLASSKKSQTMPPARIMTGNRQLRSTNRPQSTEMLNSSNSASPSNSFRMDFAREHRRESRRSSGETQNEIEKDEKLRAALHVLLKN